MARLVVEQHMAKLLVDEFEACLEQQLAHHLAL